MSNMVVSTVSIDARLSTSPGSSRPRSLEHVLSDPRAKPEEACMLTMSRESLREDVAALIDATLTEEESTVLRMRYGLGREERSMWEAEIEAEGQRAQRGYGATLVQIARDLSISHSLVRSILHRATKKLRKHESLQSLHDNHLVSL
mmetsp:Transcript_39164/g.78309  ORF Transcript_39164/g.78309 Transcript_39164/m.78309 type:complete len:147 (-) Transcript_39164:80-520(-)